MTYRNALRAIATTALLALSGLTHALQLGQLEVQSRLGDPFRAHVVVLVGANEDVGTLRAAVLPDFAHAANAALTRAVADLRARVVAAADGSVYVELTSAAPMREPLLALRVRVEHAGGANSRNYEALVDPIPSVRARAPRRAAPVAPVRDERAAAPAPQRRSVTDPVPVLGSAGATQYGPVRAGENLWQIARKVRPDARISVPAMIDALHAANPDAFTDGDVNRLKLGAMLAVPGIADPALAAAPKTAQAAPPIVAPSVPKPVATEPVATAPAIPLETKVETAPTPEPVTVLEVADAPVATAPASAANNAAEQPGALRPATPVATTRDPAASAANPDQDLRISKRTVDLSVMLFGGLFVVILLGLLARRLRVLREHRAVEVKRRVEDQARLEALAQKVAQRETVIGTSNGKIIPMRRKHETPTQKPVEDNPFAEIDLNLAYGRYDEAERVLKDIITAAPRNHQAKLKLAEAYFVAGRADDFAAVAYDLQRNHREFITDAEWERLLDMGRSVAPSHRLFGGPTA